MLRSDCYLKSLLYTKCDSKRAAFTANPFGFTKQLLGQKWSGTLVCPVEEINQHLSETYSDSRREGDLAPCRELIRPVSHLARSCQRIWIHTTQACGNRSCDIPRSREDQGTHTRLLQQFQLEIDFWHNNICVVSPRPNISSWWMPAEPTVGGSAVSQSRWAAGRFRGNLCTER